MPAKLHQRPAATIRARARRRAVWPAIEHSSSPLTPRGAGRQPRTVAPLRVSAPAAPAAALRWPTFDFTEPSAIEPGAAPALPKTSVRLLSSVASPTRVEVPCASTNVAVAGSTPAEIGVGGEL